MSLPLVVATAAVVVLFVTVARVRARRGGRKSLVSNLFRLKGAAGRVGAVRIRLQSPGLTARSHGE